jgi:hypothetical protein
MFLLIIIFILKHQYLRCSKTDYSNFKNVFLHQPKYEI